MNPPRSTPARRRTLSAEERRLWAEVARSVAALPGRALPDVPPSLVATQETSPPPTTAPPKPKAKPASKPASQVPAKAPIKPAGPPLAPLDRKTLRAVAKGRRVVEGVIDLHGLTQARAHAALVRFLTRSQREGHGLVLVVTGKGGLAGTPEGDLHERGVLRRMTPHWLSLPDLRAIVLGFDEAAPHQGGAGALYVRLRRARA